MIDSNYFIETFGCQMNVADSELVAGLLEDCGYSQTQDMTKADIIFMNTCAIREKAEETVHNRLDSIHYLKKKNPQLYPEGFCRTKKSGRCFFVSSECCFELL